MVQQVYPFGENPYSLLLSDSLPGAPRNDTPACIYVRKGDPDGPMRLLAYDNSLSMPVPARSADEGAGSGRASSSTATATTVDLDSSAVSSSSTSSSSSAMHFPSDEAAAGGATPTKEPAPVPALPRSHALHGSPCVVCGTRLSNRSSNITSALSSDGAAGVPFESAQADMAARARAAADNSQPHSAPIRPLGHVCEKCLTLIAHQQLERCLIFETLKKTTNSLKKRLQRKQRREAREALDKEVQRRNALPSQTAGTDSDNRSSKSSTSSSNEGTSSNKQKGSRGGVSKKNAAGRGRGRARGNAAAAAAALSCRCIFHSPNPIVLSESEMVQLEGVISRRASSASGECCCSRIPSGRSNLTGLPSSSQSAAGDAGTIMAGGGGEEGTHVPTGSDSAAHGFRFRWPLGRPVGATAAGGLMDTSASGTTGDGAAEPIFLCPLVRQSNDETRARCAHMLPGALFCDCAECKLACGKLTKSPPPTGTLRMRLYPSYEQQRKLLQMMDETEYLKAVCAHQLNGEYSWIRSRAPARTTPSGDTAEADDDDESEANSAEEELQGLVELLLGHDKARKDPPDDNTSGSGSAQVSPLQDRVNKANELRKAALAKLPRRKSRRESTRTPWDPDFLVDPSGTSFESKEDTTTKGQHRGYSSNEAEVALRTIFAQLRNDDIILSDAEKARLKDLPASQRQSAIHDVVNNLAREKAAVAQGRKTHFQLRDAIDSDKRKVSMEIQSREWNDVAAGHLSFIRAIRIGRRRRWKDPDHALLFAGASPGHLPLKIPHAARVVLDRRTNCFWIHFPFPKTVKSAAPAVNPLVSENSLPPPADGHVSTSADGPVSTSASDLAVAPPVRGKDIGAVDPNSSDLTAADLSHGGVYAIGASDFIPRLQRLLDIASYLQSIGKHVPAQRMYEKASNFARTFRHRAVSCLTNLFDLVL